MIFFWILKTCWRSPSPCPLSPVSTLHTIHPICSFELQIPTTFFHIVRCRSTTESAVLMCFNVSWVVSLILRLSWCYHDSLLRRQLYCFCVLERAQGSGSMISRSWGPRHRGLSLSGLGSRQGCHPRTWRVRWGSPRTTRSSPPSAARPGSARWAHTCLWVRRPHLTLRLGSEILLEPGVGLLRGVVGGQQEGHCVPQQTLVMQRRRTRLYIYFYLSFKYFLIYW